jgi:hypothetical protein
MAELRITIIVVVLMALIFSAIDGRRGHSHGHQSGGGGHGDGYDGGPSNDCTNNPEEEPFMPLCQSTTPVSSKSLSSTEKPTTSVGDGSSTRTGGPSTTTGSTGRTSNDGSTTIVDGTSTTTVTTGRTSTTPQPTSLERAHWCRFGNGTFLALGYTYFETPCKLCQCMTSRAIGCDLLKCMPTYCVNDSMISRRSGQCCTQCAYEVVRNTCEYGGVSFPHG